jgi:hypothetical protein
MLSCSIEYPGCSLKMIEGPRLKIVVNSWCCFFQVQRVSNPWVGFVFGVEGKGRGFSPRTLREQKALQVAGNRWQVGGSGAEGASASHGDGLKEALTAGISLSSQIRVTGGRYSTLLTKLPLLQVVANVNICDLVNVIRSSLE